MTPWTAACQASLSFTTFLNLLKFMSIESVMPFNPVSPFSSCPESSPASRSFLMSQLFTSGSQNIGASASAWILPMNIQGWFPLGLTCCPTDSQESSPAPQFESISSSLNVHKKEEGVWDRGKSFVLNILGLLTGVWHFHSVIGKAWGYMSKR